MSILGKIFEKLGIGKRQIESPAPSGGVPKRPMFGDVQSGGSSTARNNPPAVAPTPISEVDVMAKLEAMANGNDQKLNWKTSIVDLMKLLDMDSSYAERKELAKELGCPADKMDDSAQMNIWLHKEVLRQLSLNGGNVPAHMLD